jgi:carbon monoxide dehydrogenase subunit G
VVTGRIKVKVGPVSLTYRGTAKFTERDPDAQVVVVEASGKETRGAGTASATVRASLEPESSGEATKVTMHTTMNVTGRPAQFGRGVMVEVGGKLVDQFAANLATLLGEEGPDSTAAADGGVAAGAAASADGGQNANGSGTATAAQQDGADPAAGGTVTAAPPAPPAPAEKEDSINLVRLVGPAILKRVVPVAAIAAALAFLGRRLWRRGRAKGADEA